MSSKAEQLVAGIGKLASLPEVCIKVNEMVDDIRSSADEIGKVISNDPALTVRILKIANSPFYGLSSEVDTVKRAITILGTVQLRDLILASSACKTFKGIPNDLVSVDDFWHHSIFCGITARMLANSCMQGRGEALFVAGLLHDVGQLIMFNKLPGQSRMALLAARKGNGEHQLHLAEKRIMGFDHMDVGSALTKQWKLPLCLQECVGFHHIPSRAEVFPQEVAIIHIAQAITNFADKETLDDGDYATIDARAWHTAGLSESVIEATISEVHTQIPEVKAMFANG